MPNVSLLPTTRTQRPSPFQRSPGQSSSLRTRSRHTLLPHLALLIIPSGPSQRDRRGHLLPLFYPPVMVCTTLSERLHLRQPSPGSVPIQIRKYSVSKYTPVINSKSPLGGHSFCRCTPVALDRLHCVTPRHCRSSPRNWMWSKVG